MLATNFEQSKRLLDAGVSPKTADVYWTNIIETSENGYFAKAESQWHIEVGKAHDPEDEVPAWSLSALWNIIHRLDKTYNFETDMSAEELMEFLVNTIVYRFNNR